MGKLAAAIDILISANSAKVKTDTDKISAIIGSASTDWKAKVESAGKVMGSAFDKSGLSIDGLVKRIGGIGLAVAGVSAGVGISTLIDKFNSAIESAAGLKEMSEKTGASIENLSAVATVAKVAGVDMESLSGSMIKLAKNMEASGGPSKDMQAALNRIGLDVRDLKGLDPAEMMKRVSDAMGGYADSAGKTAIATTLFGKSGAQMLPVLKEMYESGALVAKTTAAQAEEADKYEKNLVRLTLTKDAMYKKVALQVLPVMSKFVETLVISKNESDKLQGSIKGLAEGGALEMFATKGVQACAFIIDAFRGVMTVVQGTGMAIGATAAAVANWSTQPFKDLKADLEALQSQTTAGSVFNTLNKQLEDSKNGANKLDEALKKIKGGNEGSVKSDGSAKQAAAFLKGLELRVTKTTEAEYAALRLKAAELGVGEAAEKWIKQIEQADFGRFVDKWSLGLESSNERLQLQIDLLGKSKEQQEILTASFEMGKNLQQTRLELEQKFGEALANEKWAEIGEAAETALNRQIELIQRRKEIEQSASFGMQTAAQKYIEEAENMGKAMEGAFGNAFKGLEDALVSLATTGKLNFEQFANGILSDMMRIMIRAMIVAPLMKALGFGTGGGGGGIMDIFSGGAKAKGAAYSGGVEFFAAGGIVNSPTAFGTSKGPAVMGEAGPEAIMPLTRGADGKLGVRASSPNVNIVVNNEGAKDGYEASAQSKDNGNGGIDVVVMVRKAVSDDLSTNGPLSKQMAGVFGLKRGG